MGSLAELRQVLLTHGASVDVSRFRAIGRGFDTHVQVHLDFHFPGGQGAWVAAGSLAEALERATDVLARHGVPARTRLARRYTG